MLLAIFCCGLMMHMGSAFYYYTKTTALLVIFTGLLFINYKWWIFAYGGILTSLAVLINIVPRTANHANIEFFICIYFMVLLFMRWRFKTPLPNGQTVNQIFRITLIGLYFMAGFHKLNSGFFNVNGSCTNNMGLWFNQYIDTNNVIIPHFITRMLQVCTILIEMIVPFGILFRRTRAATVLALACFHFYLSLCGVPNFSAFAAFLLTGSILNLDKEIPKQLTKGLRYLIFFSVVAVVFAKIVYIKNWVPYRLIICCVAIIYNIGWIAFFVALLKFRRIEKCVYLFSWWHPTLALLIIIWASQSYVGLSSAGTLTMYSNLVTEKEHSNHFLIDTKKTKIWNFEEDYVTIVSLPDKCKGSGANKLTGYSLPVTEFKKAVKKWTKYKEPLPCTLIYKGKTIVMRDVKASKYNDPNIEWWQRFLYYRRLNFSCNECMW